VGGENRGSGEGKARKQRITLAAGRRSPRQTSTNLGAGRSRTPPHRQTKASPHGLPCQPLAMRRQQSGSEMEGRCCRISRWVTKSCRSAMAASTGPIWRAAGAVHCPIEPFLAWQDCRRRVERSRIAAYAGWGCWEDRQRAQIAGAISSPGQASHLLNSASGLGLCRGGAGRPETSRCLLFGGEGRNRFPLYPVDLGSEICAILSDLSGGRQMRRDDWRTAMDVLPPCLQAQFDKGRRCVVEFKRQPHNVPHCLGCQRSRALADLRYPPNGGDPRAKFTAGATLSAQT
jgi:hypothetical protein